MINVMALSFSIAPPVFPDPDNPDFSFETNDWLDMPVTPDTLDEQPSSTDYRSFLLNQY